MEECGVERVPSIWSALWISRRVPASRISKVRGRFLREEDDHRGLAWLPLKGDASADGVPDLDLTAGSPGVPDREGRAGLVPVDIPPF